MVRWDLYTGSILPHTQLRLGYNDVADRYELSASAGVNFIIDGVTSLNVTSITSSYTTSSITETVHHFSSSGDSHFGNDNNDRGGGVYIKDSGTSGNRVSLNYLTLYGNSSNGSN